MSRINGDKSRFNRERKQNIKRRERNRKLRESLATPVASADKGTVAMKKVSS